MQLILEVWQYIEFHQISLPFQELFHSCPHLADLLLKSQRCPASSPCVNEDLYVAIGNQVTAQSDLSAQSAWLFRLFSEGQETLKAAGTNIILLSKTLCQSRMACQWVGAGVSHRLNEADETSRPRGTGASAWRKKWAIYWAAYRTTQTAEFVCRHASGSEFAIKLRGTDMSVDNGLMLAMCIQRLSPQMSCQWVRVSIKPWGTGTPARQ